MNPDNSFPDLGCVCANLRRAARLVTQLYSRQMGGIVEPTQYALLSALDRKPGCSQAALCQALGLDKTSLSRNLLLMNRNGWIEPETSGDRRRRGFCLTEAGRQVFAQTAPGWKRAQAELRKAMPAGEWESMRRTVALIARAAVQASRQPQST